MKLETLSQHQSAGAVATDPQMPGSAVDHLFGEWLPRLLEDKKHLVDVIKSVYQWNITRDSRVVSVWCMTRLLIYLFCCLLGVISVCAGDKPFELVYIMRYLTLH